MFRSKIILLTNYAKSPLIIFIIISIGILTIDNTLFYDRQSNKVVVNQDNLRQFVNVQYGLDNADMINGYIDSLDRDNKKSLVNDYLTNEALYNFAINRSLDKNDEELKSVITAKARNIIEMMVNAEQGIPSISDAKEHFNKESHHYNKPETYDLVMINRLQNDASLTGLLREQDLSLRQLVQMSDLNDFDKILRQTETGSIEKLFGRVQAVSIVGQKDDVWFGPYKSDSGYHWIKKQTRAALNPDFEAIQDQVIADLYQTRIDQRYQEIIDELIAQLTVKTEV